MNNKINHELFDNLLSILGYLEDGRIFLARQRLEELLGYNSDKVA